VPTGHSMQGVSASVVVRAAEPSDATFLALAMQEADRGHTGIGSWDVMFPGAEGERLAALSRLCTASARSYVHWSTFLVAEADGIAVGTAASYVPAEMPHSFFVEACLDALGWTEAETADRCRGAWSRDYFSVPLPGETLRVEWVYTDPAFRGNGVCAVLLDRLLDLARQQGRDSAHVGTYIGNDPAITAYHKSGFEYFAECRHRDYQDRFRTPGLVFLRRRL
jgi:GNAT superfamily N-acetyltransferase